MPRYNGRSTLERKPAVRNIWESKIPSLSEDNEHTQTVRAVVAAFERDRNGLATLAQEVTFLKRDRYQSVEMQRLLDDLHRKEVELARTTVTAFARAHALGVHRMFIGSDVLGYSPDAKSAGQLRPAAEPVMRWVAEHCPVPELVIVPDEEETLSQAAAMAKYVQQQFAELNFFQLDPAEVEAAQVQIEADVTAGRYFSSSRHRQTENEVRPLTTTRGGLKFMATLDAFSPDHQIIYVGNRQIGRYSYLGEQNPGPRERHMTQLFNGWHLTMFNPLPPRVIADTWQKIRMQKQKGFSSAAISGVVRNEVRRVKRTIYHND